MKIEPNKFKQLVVAIYETDYREGALLTPAQAEAIVSIARLAVDADLSEDSDEVEMYDALAALVCSLAGIAPTAIQEAEAVANRGFDDREKRMKARAAELTTRRARELAYAMANILTIADLDIQPIENAFLHTLQDALELDDERLAALAGFVNEALASDDE